MNSLGRTQMEDDAKDAFVQGRFVSSQHEIRKHLPSAPVSLLSSFDRYQLNALVNKLISDECAEWEDRQMDFLLDGQLLLEPLGTFLQSRGFVSEHEVEIECVLSQPGPRPEDSVTHDDWVGAVVDCQHAYVTGSYDGSLRVGGLPNGDLTLTRHVGPVKCVTCVRCQTPDAIAFVSGGDDQTLLFWLLNAVSRSVQCVQLGRGHERSVETVSANSDGTRVASGGFDTYLKIWDASYALSDTIESDPPMNKRAKVDHGATSTTVTPVVTLEAHREAVTGTCWSGTTEVTTCSWDRTIRLWDLEMAAQKHQLAGNKAFTSLSWSPLAGLLLTGATDRYVRLWDLRSKEGALVKQTFAGHTGWVSCVCWNGSDANQFVSGAYDCSLKVWDVRNCQVPLYEISGHSDKVLCVDWSSSKRLLSGGADRLLNVFQFDGERL